MYFFSIKTFFYFSSNICYICINYLSCKIQFGISSNLYKEKFVAYELSKKTWFTKKSCSSINFFVDFDLRRSVQNYNKLGYITIHNSLYSFKWNLAPCTLHLAPCTLHLVNKYKHFWLKLLIVSGLYWEANFFVLTRLSN